MAWYRAGTVAVTNGSAVVTGTGTAFVANVQAGHAINLPDNRAYEVLAVNSDTQITLGSNYLGATAGGQPYGVQPNQGFAQQAATILTNFYTQFQAYLTTVLAGLFGDGSAARPGIAFSADQDTGIRRVGENAVALVSGGADAIAIDGNRHVGIGVTQPTVLSQNLRTLHLYGPTGSIVLLDGGGGALGQIITDGSGAVFGTRTAHPTLFTTQAAERMRIDTAGNVGIGTTAPANYGAGSANVHLKASAAAIQTIESGNCVGQASANNNLGMIVGTTSASPLIIYANNAERGRFDISGNLLVGVTSGGSHVIRKAVPDNAGNATLLLQGTNEITAAFYAVAGGSTGSAANAAFKVNKDAGTGRSINAAGTINASGADYAEYMLKAAGCGTILKGDICGVNSNGELVRTWADARSFMVKSTNPNLVGGDNWDAHIPPKPEAPMYAPPSYDGPPMPDAVAEPVEPAPSDPAPAQPVRGDDEDEMAFIRRMAAYIVEASAWSNAVEARPAAQLAYAEAVAAAERYAVDRAAYFDRRSAYFSVEAQAEADHAAAVKQHETDLAAWEVLHEEARSHVDRIAYCGQVPVNVEGDCAVGDYIVAAANGAGIKGVAVHPDDMTLPQYMRRVGKVLAIGADGRPIIDVQHG